MINSRSLAEVPCKRIQAVQHAAVHCKSSISLDLPKHAELSWTLWWPLFLSCTIGPSGRLRGQNSMILVDMAKDKRSLVFCDWRRAEPTEAPAKLLSSPVALNQLLLFYSRPNHPFISLLVCRKLLRHETSCYLGHNPAKEYFKDSISTPHPPQLGDYQYRIDIELATNQNHN